MSILVHKYIFNILNMDIKSLFFNIIVKRIKANIKDVYIFTYSFAREGILFTKDITT